MASSENTALGPACRATLSMIRARSRVLLPFFVIFLAGSVVDSLYPGWDDTLHVFARWLATIFSLVALVLQIPLLAMALEWLDGKEGRFWEGSRLTAVRTLQLLWYSLGISWRAIIVFIAVLFSVVGGLRLALGPVAAQFLSFQGLGPERALGFLEVLSEIASAIVAAPYFIALPAILETGEGNSYAFPMSWRAMRPLFWRLLGLNFGILVPVSLLDMAWDGSSGAVWMLGKIAIGAAAAAGTIFLTLLSAVLFKSHGRDGEEPARADAAAIAAS